MSKASLFKRIMEMMRVPAEKQKPIDVVNFIGPQKPVPDYGGYMVGKGKHQDIEDIMGNQELEGYFDRNAEPYYEDYANYRYHGDIPEKMKKKAQGFVDPDVAKKLGMKPNPDALGIKYANRYYPGKFSYELTPAGRMQLEENYNANLLNNFRDEQKKNIEYWKSQGMSDEDIINVYR